MDSAEVEAWIEYNYLALPEDAQEMVQHFISRQKRVQTYVSATAPVIGFSLFAVNKYKMKFGMPMNMLMLCGLMYGYERLFTFGVRVDKRVAFRAIFEMNQHSVLDPSKRGLKLFNQKHSSRI